MNKTELKHYTCPVKGCGGDLVWEVDQWVCPECGAVLRDQVREYKLGEYGVRDGLLVKLCGQCGKFKSVETEYYKRQGGVKSMCKECFIKKTAENKRKRKLEVRG